MAERIGGTGGGETRVTESAANAVFLWLGLPLIGAATGWLALLGIDGLVGLPWPPTPGWLEFIAELPQLEATIGAAALGGVGGLGLALAGAHEQLRVTVSGSRVRLARGDGATREVDRSAIAMAFVDGKALVLLDRVGGELAREVSDLDPRRLAEAFRAHGYPWRPEGDPYRDAFRRWVPGLPDLPAGGDALMRARQTALDKDNRREAAELRDELSRLGVVVRDEGKRQHWRLVARGDEHP